jgi:hypothetical protein
MSTKPKRLSKSHSHVADKGGHCDLSEAMLTLSSNYQVSATLGEVFFSRKTNLRDRNTWIIDKNALPMLTDVTDAPCYLQHCLKSKLFRKSPNTYIGLYDHRQVLTIQLLTLFLALPWRWRRYIPPKRRFSQDPHCAASKKTAFFIFTAVKTSNPTTQISEWNLWYWSSWWWNCAVGLSKSP